MMVIENISQLRIFMNSFLNQREAACKALGDSQSLRYVMDLRNAFGPIGTTTMRRFALEIRNRENTLIKILPSAHGRHAAIRERMLIFINQCKLAVKDIPSEMGE